MRRGSLVLAFVSSLAVAPAFAADGPTGGVEVGANIASANLYGRDATGVEASMKAGFLAGGFAILPVTAGFAIQPEVVYAQKYFKVTDTHAGGANDEKWDWVEVPILARIGPALGAKASAYAVVGPAFSFKVRAKESGSGGGRDQTDHIQSPDISIIGGAGISVGLFSVEARYDGGIRNINKDLSGPGGDLGVKTRTISVLARVAFR